MSDAKRPFRYGATPYGAVLEWLREYTGLDVAMNMKDEWVVAFFRWFPFHALYHSEDIVCDSQAEAIRTALEIVSKEFGLSRLEDK